MIPQFSKLLFSRKLHKLFFNNINNIILVVCKENSPHAARRQS